MVEAYIYNPKFYPPQHHCIARMYNSRRGPSQRGFEPRIVSLIDKRFIAVPSRARHTNDGVFISSFCGAVSNLRLGV